MDSRTHEQEPHSIGEEDHPEKLSVLKKVKARARKIKDNITGHGHGVHPNDDHPYQDLHEEEEDDDDDAEDKNDDMVVDPQVHGAPVYESESARKDARNEDVNLAKPKVSLGERSEDVNTGQPKFDLGERSEEVSVGKPKVSLGERGEDVNTEKPKVSLGERGEDTEKPKVSLGGRGEDVNTEKPKVSLGERDEDTEKPKISLGERGEDVNTEKPKDSLGERGEDTEKPKVSLGERGEDVDTEKPSLGERGEDVNTEKPKFSLGERGEDEDIGTPKFGLGERLPSPEGPQSPKDAFHAADPGNYPTQITDPTGAGGDEANVEPVIRSFEKMEVRDKSEQKMEVRDKSEHGKTPTRNPTGSHDQFTPELPISKTDDIPENTRPVHETGPNQPNQSSYLSTATSAAVSAKNVIASKIGYGGNNGTDTTAAHPEKGVLPGTDTRAAALPEGEHQKKGVTDYGRQISSTVYGAVAGAGSAVLSKVPGTGSTTKETSTGTGTGTTPGTETGVDRGVKAKGYLAEKLKPGEEDRALSEVISDALYRREEPNNRPMGKVAVSPEVAGRLGTDSDETVTGGEENPGQTYVGKLTGAVTSWFGKGGETNPSQIIHDKSPKSRDETHGTAEEEQSSMGARRDEVGHENAERGRLQESTA